MSAPAKVAGQADPARLLRVMTCGSVDDGKSTLLGRLLVETDSVSTDVLETLRRDSGPQFAQAGDVDYSLVFDGLQDERRQSITIDVGYRFFSTESRSYIVADAPGHEQYTRNMATAASNADVAVLLIDATKGLLPQTRRHAMICSLFRVPHLILCINKMDSVGYDETVFRAILSEFAGLFERLGFASISAIPASAARGENVTRPSVRMPWYTGPHLLAALEATPAAVSRTDLALRFPVQWVNRPFDGFRGLSGTVAQGAVSVGDAVTVLPSGEEARIARITGFDGDVPTANAGDATTLLLDRELDVSRGDLLATPADLPFVSDEFTAQLLWCSTDRMVAGRRYLAKFGGQSVVATVIGVESRIAVENFTDEPARSLGLNEIGRCRIKTSVPVPLDPYARNRTTGSFVLIDRVSFETAAAGMVLEAASASNLIWQTSSITPAVRADMKGQRACILWFTGLSGSGKSTIADAVERALNSRGHHTMMLDGDNLRQGLNRDLSFSEEDRVENIRRAAEVGKLFCNAGLITLCCFITPYRNDRLMVRDIVGSDNYIEVFVDTPVEECIRRDPKGLYAKAISGAITNFTGISAPYEAPETPGIRIGTLEHSPEEAVRIILQYLAVFQEGQISAP